MLINGISNENCDELYWFQELCPDRDSVMEKFPSGASSSQYYNPLMIIILISG